MQFVRRIFVILLISGVFATLAQAATPSEDGNSVDDAPDQDELDAVAATSAANDDEPAPPATESSDDGIDAMSGSLDDSIGSIKSGRETRGKVFKGDLRVGYTYTEEDNRDASRESLSEWQGRFRMGGTFSLTDKLVFGGRIATTCATDDCNPDISFDSTLPNSSSIDNGDITFDQLYIHLFRREKFDVAIGRLQTKFVSSAGVFAKSLDRNDGHGTNVNWTDGVHSIWHANSEWTGHLILQRNQADGTGNIRRGPIDFHHDDARTTYFMSWENGRRFGPINQQSFDITYMPRSLMKDGDRSGRIEDYIGIVARFAASWPQGSIGRHLTVAGEIGYAPETPTRAAMGLAGNGDTDGLAWYISASVMDVIPDHSIGINFGRADPGWLLSPQYRENEEVIEIRYIWRRSPNLAIDMRARWRDEREQLEDAAQLREQLNVFVRFTLGFGH